MDKENNIQRQKEWNEYFSRFGYKLVKRTYFWKFFAIIVFITLMFGCVYFVYNLQNGSFDSLINPSFNNSVKSTTANNYDFNPATTNNYEHTIENNNTFYIKNIIKCPE